jgi:hypothetical protein
MISGFATVRHGLRLFAALCGYCESDDTQNDTRGDELGDPLTW